MDLLLEFHRLAAPYLVVAVLIAVSLSRWCHGAREPWLPLVALLMAGLAFVFPTLILLAVVFYWLLIRARYPDVEPGPDADPDDPTPAGPQR